MGVRFTRDAEIERVAKNKEARKNKWEYLITHSIVEAVRYARDNGWENKKVQVRQISEEEWAVEPFEKDCGCPNILAFDDYFIREGEDIAPF